MLPYPNINPNIIEIGPFKLRWYGMMYVLGFLACYFLIGKQRRARHLGLVGAPLQDLIFSLAIGLIVGARLGYILFYQFSSYTDYLRHPLEIIAIWHGGMFPWWTHWCSARGPHLFSTAQDSFLGGSGCRRCNRPHCSWLGTFGKLY